MPPSLAGCRQAGLTKDIGKDGDEKTRETQDKWEKAFRELGFGDARVDLVKKVLEEANAEVTATAKRVRELEAKLDADAETDKINLRKLLHAKYLSAPGVQVVNACD